MRPEIEAVTDRSSLRAYLETLEGEAGLLTARCVAFRAAARVLPLALAYFHSEDAAKRDLTAVPVFRALAIAGVVSTWPTPKIDRAAAAAFAVDAGANAANAAAAMAAFAADANAALAAADATGAAAFAAGAAANAALAADATIWDLVRSDLRWCDEHPTQTLPALWPSLGELDELRKIWETAKQRMEADSTSDWSWSFWILWYERVRAGRDVHADKLAEILNPLREDDWKRGPAHINPLFDDLLALYREEDELEALRERARRLEAERPEKTKIASIAQRSHNMPPELIDETQLVQTVELIWEQVAETRSELDKPNPEKSRLRALGSSMLEGMRTVAAYLGNKCDLFLEEAMKSGGKWAGPAIFGALVSPSLIEFVRNLLKFAGMP